MLAATLPTERLVWMRLLPLDDAADLVQAAPAKEREGLLALLDVTLLFLGEMLTATAMGWYEEQLATAIVLALFVPLIISSGGNSGSQATTLIIRAMALVKSRREIGRACSAAKSQLVLRSVSSWRLGSIRLLLWHELFGSYGQHYFVVAITVSLSLVGVVLWGTLAGSTLPFALRFVKLDPASASALLIATLVDVTGLVIYFSIAGFVLRGTVL